MANPFVVYLCVCVLCFCGGWVCHYLWCEQRYWANVLKQLRSDRFCRILKESE